jgi:hypothetical protein
MQSTATTTSDKGENTESETTVMPSDEKRPATQGAGLSAQHQSGFSFGFDNLAATVKTRGADVVAQMHFTGGGLQGNAWNVQRVV